jgi:hypothetical protein
MRQLHPHEAAFKGQNRPAAWHVLSGQSQTLLISKNPGAGGRSYEAVQELTERKAYYPV